MKSERKIVVRGGYGLTNFGDDALMKVIYDDFIEEKRMVTFSSNFADYLCKIAPFASFIPIQNRYDDYEILIYGGGTQFYSFFPKSRFNLKRTVGRYIRSAIHILKKLNNILMKSQNSSNNLVKGALGIGVGPFLLEGNPQVEINTKKLFKELDFITVRDSFSSNKMKEWGIKKYSHLTDICYASKHDLFFKNSSPGIKKIGIIVRDWKHTFQGGAYDENLLKSIPILRNIGYTVEFIVFARGRDPIWLSKLENMNEEPIVWNPDNITVEEYIETLNEYDLFITARYHGAVYATLLGKPFISINVEQKLEMISKLYKGGSEVWSFNFDMDYLLEKVKIISENYNDYKNKVFTITKKETLLALRMKNDFLNFIRK